MAKLEKTTTGYYKANQGFATTFDGEPLFVQKGELVRRGHPLLDGREDLFEPATQISRFDVEQATAAPGEKRGASRGRRAKVHNETEEPTPEPEPAPEPTPDEPEEDE